MNRRAAIAPPLAVRRVAARVVACFAPRLFAPRFLAASLLAASFLAAGLGMTGLGWGPAPAHAQAGPSFGQYLVVLDDSGSMDRSDPRRLVVMAALALAAALEDGDQVMLVGLNELASGEVSGPRFVSPRELLSGRDGGEGAQPVTGERPARLGRHQGQTPCRAGLAQAQSILNAVASSGAPQTLLLLTDGACNGGAVESANAWLGSVRAHTDSRFRFVVLMREGGGRLDPALSAYAERTGWRGDTRVSFDARALLRAFADVLSFSRGLRYDDGGRIGLERTFAGARAVRVLAIHEQGAPRIALTHVEGTGSESPITTGPTFRHAEHGWSVRAARDNPTPTPYAVRSGTAGADVLVVPVYGRLEVEAVVGPCGDAPALPWNAERAVRAGQPACAWARLVGGTGETIDPRRSFAFSMEVCEDPACERSSAMQPAEDGSFNAQLGAGFEVGRHERIFHAHGGALAERIVQPRGFSSMAFGVQHIAAAATPDQPLTELDLGALPKPTTEDVQLVARGSFPAGARARVQCAVEGDAAVAACMECTPRTEIVDLQDSIPLQLEVRGTTFCPAVSEAGGQDLPVRLHITLEPVGTEDVPAHAFPLRARLSYAAAEPVAIVVRGGERAEASVRLPAPLPQEEVSIAVEVDRGDLEAGAVNDTVRLRAGDDRRAAVDLFAEAEDCCEVGQTIGHVVLTPASGGPSLRVPLEISVEDPGFWTCPGKQIAFWTGVALLFALLVWVIRGFVSPAKFRQGATLMYASSHDALLGLRDGDEGWRKLERFPETRRGFRRSAALYLGGPRAPLPSLKRMPADAFFEAQKGGSVRLVVRGPSVEKFEESSGWTEVSPGTYPVSSRITLRRGDDVYLQFRQ